MKRRVFLSSSIAAGLYAGSSVASQDATRRVGVMGHTGRGNYGHGLDTVWQNIPNAQVVGVSDGNEAGLAAELKKLNVSSGYLDYREMLSAQQPEFVSVAPRHPDQHFDMIMAAIASGVRGIYVEKPFCRTPAEADAIVSSSLKAGTKIAVAHRNRYHPVLVLIKQMIADGQLGRLLEMRGRGKGDRRGGGECLWVLGCHVMNLFEYIGGKPLSCSATLLTNGARVTAADVAPGNEALGPLAGNEVHAHYQMESGVFAAYDSIANDGTKDSYCMHFIGSDGVIALHIDANPVAHIVSGNPFAVDMKPRQWVPITSAGPGKPEPHPGRVADVHNHVAGVNDLIAAVDEDRQPLCDARSGALTVEMICAAFESHRQNSKSVSLPLERRDHPLNRL